MTSEISAEGSTVAQLPASNNIARRSVSIFSRKGTDTPTPTAQALALSSVNMAWGAPSSPTNGSASLSKAKSKRWTLSGRVEARIPEGTILRAVPRDAPKTTMTPLEREMATSPNDEILRAIGLPPESAPTSPIGPSSPLADITNVSPQRYYSKRAKKGQQDILGVWRDGQVQWGKENPLRGEPVARPKTADGTRRSSSLDGHKLVKPKIQVIIPENHSARRPFGFMPFFQNNSMDRVNMASPPEVSPPSVTSGFSMGSRQVSAISPPTIHKPKPQRPFQPLTTAIDQSPAFGGGLLPENPAHSRTVSVNSSSSDSEGDENASPPRSSRSSMTSIGVHNEEQPVRKDESSSRRGSTSSETSFTKDDDATGLDKIFVETTIVQTSSHNPAPQGPRMTDMVNMMRSPSMQRRPDSLRKKRLSSSRGNKILARINPREELNLNRSDTPSLDEAVRNLEDSLLSFNYDNAADAPEVVERSISPIPEIILSPVDAPPALPRKSSKRARSSFSPPPSTPTQAPITPPARASAPPPASMVGSTFTAAMEATRQAQAQRRQKMQSFRRDRRESYGRLKRMSSVRSVLSLVREEDEFVHVDASDAEMVVYHILSKSETMDDLFNAALITRGFHQIFKQHELGLMRQTLHKQSAPHWEFRESCLSVDEDEDNSALPAPEYTPTTYYQGYMADMAAVGSLKQLVLKQCASLLRVDSLTGVNSGDSPRVDAALFRIWTFCQVFGSNKGREDDIVAQMDWLRGGVLAHQESCTSTISTHDSFYISNVLLSAPEHFAKGNAGGLSAEDLYDMLEMWSCLTKLTSGLAGKTQQARQFGVFDETDVAGGDIDGEEAMLEEWQAYLLTLGVGPILDIVVALASGDSHTAFAVAQYKGLTNWTAPLVGSSRTTFLHEAVSRLYEERICEVFSPEQVQMTEMRSIRRARDSEFRQRRLSVRSMQEPDRRTSLTREWGSFRSVSGPSTVTLSSSGFSNPSPPTRGPPPPSRVAPTNPRRYSAPLSSSIRTSYFPTSESIAEEFLPAYDPAAEYERERERKRQVHPLQRAMQDEDYDPSQNSAEKAVFRIVEMGFTPEEAKGALKITDMGDGLRVDRAVEYLMRSKGFN